MYEYRCALVRTVDGDTLRLDVDLGCDIHTLMTVRLYGINAPEMSTDAGKAAKVAAVSWLTESGQLRLATTKDRREKYGRYLATVYRDGDAQPLNAWMVEHGHAVVYMP